MVARVLARTCGATPVPYTDLFVVYTNKLNSLDEAKMAERMTRGSVLIFMIKSGAWFGKIRTRWVPTPPQVI